jgi:Type II CAAX prenyl endopeptidase Rce1-like
MDTKKRSALTLLVLLVILALAAALNTVLPQGNIAGMPVSQESPIPKWQLMLGGAGITFVLYGALGFLGLFLWRKLGFPEIWEEAVSSRQRFGIPALVGAGLGIVLIIGDLLFSRINGVGRLIHPPFPTSLVASVSAGIGEEMIFRLFFISFWTWLVGKVILRGRGLSVVYWVVASFAALAHSAAHLPTLMILFGVTDPLKFSPVLLLEVFLLNSLISVFGAYYFRKSGFLATVGIHFWTDFVWHMLWGLF